MLLFALRFHVFEGFGVNSRSQAPPVPAGHGFITVLLVRSPGH